MQVVAPAERKGRPLNRHPGARIATWLEAFWATHGWRLAADTLTVATVEHQIKRWCQAERFVLRPHVLHQRDLVAAGVDDPGAGFDLAHAVPPPMRSRSFAMARISARPSLMSLRG